MLRAKITTDICSLRKPYSCKMFKQTWTLEGDKRRGMGYRFPQPTTGHGARRKLLPTGSENDFSAFSAWRLSL